MMRGHGRGALDRAPLDRPAQRDPCMACVFVASAVAWCVVALFVWLIVGAVT